MPTGKRKVRNRLSKNDVDSTDQGNRAGPVLLNKLIPRGITQSIFRRNKNQSQSQIVQEACDSPMLPAIVQTSGQSSAGKNSHTHGSNSGLNQLASPSLTSYQSSGYGSQPHSARASLQEQSLPVVASQTGLNSAGVDSSDRRVSVESGYGESPSCIRRNGTGSSREELVKNSRTHGNKKPIASLGSHSPRTSQTQYQCPITITCLKIGRSQDTRDQRDHSRERTFVVVNSRRYQISANGAVVNEGAPVLNKKKKTSISQLHKMSLQCRKPSQVVLPPISSTRYSVPNSFGMRVQPVATSSATVQSSDLADLVTVVTSPKVSLPSGPTRNEQRTSSNDNPVAMVTHKVPPVSPATPLLVMNEEDNEPGGVLDDNRPRSRRKNAIVLAEDKPDVNALLAAIPQIHLISPTPIPMYSQPPSQAESTCTSPSDS